MLPVPGEAPAGVVPKDTGTLEALLRQILGRLSESERKTLFSAVVSSGGLTVQDGGAIRLLLSNGVSIFYAGPLTFGDPPVSYNGIIMRRANGSPIFYTFPVNGDVNVIAYRFLDGDGSEILSSDALTGGLARPYIPLSGVPVLSSAIPMLTNASFVSTWSTGAVAKQQPFVQITALLRSESGGVGTARFTINGTPAGTSMPIAANSFAWQTPQVLALPGSFYDDVSIELEIQRTNGTGSVGGVFKGYQRQT